MSDTFAEFFGGVFPAPADVRDGEEYGPSGDDLVGTLEQGVLPDDVAGNQCSCSIYVADVHAEPIKNAKLTVIPCDPTQFVGSSLIHDRNDIPKSNASGLIQVTLARGLRCIITIHFARCSKSFERTIPNAASYNLALTVS